MIEKFANAIAERLAKVLSVKTLTVRETAIRLAIHYIDSPYIWGGNDPYDGSDCSGFVGFILRSCGMMEYSRDMRATDMYDSFMRVEKPSQGTLVFYGQLNSGITHVMLCINEVLCIGATGGNSKCTDAKYSLSVGARVKVMPIYYRRDVVGYADPFAGKE